MPLVTGLDCTVEKLLNHRASAMEQEKTLHFRAVNTRTESYSESTAMCLRSMRGGFIFRDSEFDRTVNHQIEWHNNSRKALPSDSVRNSMESVGIIFGWKPQYILVTVTVTSNH
jgi:hypothetical protein